MSIVSTVNIYLPKELTGVVKSYFTLFDKIANGEYDNETVLPNMALGAAKRGGQPLLIELFTLRDIFGIHKDDIKSKYDIGKEISRLRKIRKQAERVGIDAKSFRDEFCF